MISSWRFFFVTLSLLYLGWPIESEKKVLTHFNVCLLLSFFLHGALKLEGFQRIRDFNAREVIMLVVQVKCKNGSGCMFLRDFLQKKIVTNSQPLLFMVKQFQNHLQKNTFTFNHYFIPPAFFLRPLLNV